MFSRLRDMITRHRRKLIFASVVVGGTVVAIKYAQHKLNEFQERQKRDFVEKSRRIQHFESTERTCNQVIIGMSTELSQAILRECNTNELLSQLRQNPPNKADIWDEIKIVAFTRLTTLIYANSMLVIALRVQMNLIGGYIYRDITNEELKITEEVKHQYLSLIRYFIHEGGLSALIRLIQSKVVGIMKQLPLSKPLTLADLEHLFWSLQMTINSDANDPNAKMAIYLLPAQLPEYSSGGPLLQKMYNETLDLLESDDVASVCSNNICRGFTLAVDTLAESIGENVMPTELVSTEATIGKHTGDVATSSKAVELHSNNNMLNINDIQVPLAKIIPIVSGLTSKGFDSAKRPQNLATSLVTFFLLVEKSKLLGANIYETFCTS